MKEIVIQEPIEFKFGNESSMIMNGKKFIQTEELVKINEDGDQALLRVVIPAQFAMEKTFKITITTYDDQVLANDYWNN